MEHALHPLREDRVVSPCVNMLSGGQSSFSQSGFSDGKIQYQRLFSKKDF